VTKKQILVASKREIGVSAEVSEMVPLMATGVQQRARKHVSRRMEAAIVNNPAINKLLADEDTIAAARRSDDDSDE